MNLVGHVAAALGRPDPPTAAFLVGCLLPDVAAIARVRLVHRPDGDVGRGVEFHHACDAAFHASDWFRSRNRAVRDELVARAVEDGPARACAHAGLEMVLDGAVVAERPVADAARIGLDALVDLAPSLALFVTEEARARWVEAATRVGRHLDPAAYADPWFVADRLVRMTAGRRRIEVRAEHTAVVAETLARHVDACVADADAVLGAVRRGVAG